jgi:hypothetical protein
MKVCKKCKGTLINNKWIPTKNLRKRVIYTVCPTCAKDSKENVNSIVLLDADFFKQHEKQSMQLLYEVENQIRATNYYSRIIIVNQKQSPILVKTSHPLLAIQIGKQFHRIYHGKLSISQNGHKGVLVRWMMNSLSPKVKVKPLPQVASA